MSRYHISSNGLEALLGFDRPLGHYFIVISRNDDAEDGETLYSNLDDTANPFPKDLNVIKQIATRFGLKIPNEMWREIQQDFIAQVGNKEVRYEENGRRTELPL